MKTPLVAATAALLLAGCAAVPHDAPRVAQMAPTALGLGADTPTVDARWWTAFDDPQLDGLIDRALAANPSLDEALARMRGAQAQVEAERANLLPQITGADIMQWQRGSKNFIGGGAPGETPSKWLGIVGATLSWNIDLFGRERAAVREARASAEAYRLDAEATRLAISTSVAETYVGLAQAHRQMDVADAFVRTRQHAVDLVQTRVRDQLSSKLDAETVQTLLAQAQQAKVRAARQYDLLLHALAALTGQGADAYAQITPPTLSLDRRPVVPDVLPADLLGRRPDLLAGQARIDAAVANRKVARTAFLPNVDIAALAGFASFGISKLFTADSATYGGGPAITVPIFEGGKLRAQYRGATADLDLAVASYDDSVVGAVRETADAITNVRSADADLAQQGGVVGSLRETVRLNDVRVSTGLSSQLDAIDSGFRLLQAEQDLVELQADSLTRRIQLVAALGGGFNPSSSLASAPAAEPRS